MTYSKSTRANKRFRPGRSAHFVYEGNVDARIGTYRLQADKVTVYEATNRYVAEGNVVFRSGRPATNHRLARGVELPNQDGLLC